MRCNIYDNLNKHYKVQHCLSDNLYGRMNKDYSFLSDKYMQKIENKT